ncbi:LysM peptidoglycan-binding domain-containing protein [Nitrosomonas mobilis]|uniref:LysM motif n=1 Tax=Nitrosomonas mobilis TaxID=51642 RepID=A0A1G5SGM3_9PROT|nr:LysM domain-containing protein [Nitrosomonas mobilis]SCZ86262.1 LysM motif [Nitrosomonas mobilis]
MRILTIITAILFTSLVSLSLANASEIKLRDNAPMRYVVTKGDTLWGIAARYLQDPWRWPDIWQMNRHDIANPHRIYPGDIIVIEKTAQGMRLRISGEKDTIRLSPRARPESLSAQAIPSIPADRIEPFLSKPLVVERNALDQMPAILGASDERVIFSTGDKVYVLDMPTDQGQKWQVFRSGKALLDPDAADHILGYEASYLGDVEITDFARISSGVVTHSVREILRGDRLVPTVASTIDDYFPHSPDFSITGRIISVYDGVNEIGENAIVVLNKGRLDAIEPGHVLAVYRKTQIRSHEGKWVDAPDERIGLVFVFRVFDRVAYALVVQSRRAIKVLDAVKAP